MTLPAPGGVTLDRWPVIGRDPVSIPLVRLQTLKREAENTRCRGGRCAPRMARHAAAGEPLGAKISKKMAVKSGER